MPRPADDEVDWYCFYLPISIFDAKVTVQLMRYETPTFDLKPCKYEEPKCRKVG